MGGRGFAPGTTRSAKPSASSAPELCKFGGGGFASQHAAEDLFGELLRSCGGQGEFCEHGVVTELHKTVSGVAVGECQGLQDGGLIIAGAGGEGRESRSRRR
jgi:hypothetical protein